MTKFTYRGKWPKFHASLKYVAGGPIVQGDEGGDEGGSDGSFAGALEDVNRAREATKEERNLANDWHDVGAGRNRITVPPAALDYPKEGRGVTSPDKGPRNAEQHLSKGGSVRARAALKRRLVNRS
jgi:hypothetical protein